MAYKYWKVFTLARQYFDRSASDKLLNALIFPIHSARIYAYLRTCGWIFSQATFLMTIWRIIYSCEHLRKDNEREAILNAQPGTCRKFLITFCPLLFALMKGSFRRMLKPNIPLPFGVTYQDPWLRPGSEKKSLKERRVHCENCM